jgi:hypothetical protein
MRKQIMIAFKGLNPKFRSEIVSAKHASPSDSTRDFRNIISEARHGLIN